MSSLTASVFEKERQCPSSEALLSYQQLDLTRGQRSSIAAHLAVCDFCSAERQLLAKYPPTRETPVSPPMPLGLRVLAEALLAGNRSGRERLLEKLFERNGQRNVSF